MNVLLIFQPLAVTAISMPPLPPASPSTDTSNISSNRVGVTRDQQNNTILTAKDSSGNVLVECVIPKGVSIEEFNVLIGYFMGYVAAMAPGPLLDDTVESIVHSGPITSGGMSPERKLGFLEGVSDALKSMEMRSKLIKDTLEALGGVALPMSPSTPQNPSSPALPPQRNSNPSGPPI